MKGTILLHGPETSSDFELAYRLEQNEHRFEVAYGSSFNELYYDFTPQPILALCRSFGGHEAAAARGCWVAPPAGPLLELAKDPRNTLLPTSRG
jgi:hypothetical protein